MRFLQYLAAETVTPLMATFQVVLLLLLVWGIYEVIVVKRTQAWTGWKVLPVAVLCFIGAGLITYFLVQGVLDVAGKEKLSDLIHSSKIVAEFILTAIQMLTVFAILRFYLRRAGVKHVWAELGWKKIPLAQLATYGIGGLGAYFIASRGALTIVDVIAPNLLSPVTQTTGYESASAPYELVIAFISLVIATPIVEELLFRGLIFKGLQKTTTITIAAIVTSVAFGAVHGSVIVGIDVAALSMVSVYLVHKTESLWPSILLHSLKNGIAFLYIFGFLSLR
jgi:membrane protease YdiL (CAAX protease family)